MSMYSLYVAYSCVGLTTVADKKPGLVPAAALQAKDAKTANLIQGAALPLLLTLHAVEPLIGHVGTH